MAQDHLIKLQCSVCKQINYMSKRNKKQVPEKVQLQKMCKFCKKRTLHKEGKK
jgi:large subunit ribosomal protein L33